MSCDNCVSRRRFLALAAAAAALSACGDGDVSGVAPKTALNPSGPPGGGASKITVIVADYVGLATIGTLVQITGTFVAAKRTGVTSFTAYFMACTHQGCLTDIVSNRFACPCHGSRFDENGAVVTGPATSPLATLPAVFDPVAGILTIN